MPGGRRGASANILFTGRVYPHKRQEDVIAAFAAYRRRYDGGARLFLVGGIFPGAYYPSLLSYAERLGVAEDVVFPGHVAFSEYLDYYRAADLFLCMSAHEGFCIPLVEAMHFGIPVLACADTAVPDTLAGSGVLLHGRDPEYVAEAMHRVLSDDAYRRRVIDGQTARLGRLSPEVLEGEYREMLDAVLGRVRGHGSGLAQSTGGKKDAGCLFTLKQPCLLWQLERMAGRRDRYVVYGAGAAGAGLYRELEGAGAGGRLVLCDSHKAGGYDSGLGCPIVSPPEAVEACGDGVFIISVQDRRAVLEIAALLLGLGVETGRILVYDKADGTFL